MLDLTHARSEFQHYLEPFDCENDKIKLKIIHTDGVVSCASEIARRMQLQEDDVQLAELIALLHDIGRFEQARLYDSFEPVTMDHAVFGVQLLFGEDQMIRRFVAEDTWDDIIREAIGRHSDYSVGEIEDARTLLHAKLIRDADKLDNCRVKLEDSVQVLLNADAEEVGRQEITDLIWETCKRHLSVRLSDRVTRMDYWVSYIAYFFDINFPETWSLIRENDYIDRIIDRIPYSNPDTKQKMEQLRQMMHERCEAAVRKLTGTE